MRSRPLCLSGLLAALLCQCAAAPAAPSRFAPGERVAVRFVQPKTDLTQTLVNPALATAMDLRHRVADPSSFPKVIEDEGLHQLLAFFDQHGFFDEARDAPIPGGYGYLTVAIGDRERVWSAGSHLDVGAAERFGTCRDQFLNTFNAITAYQTSSMEASDVLEQTRRLQERNQKLLQSRGKQ